MHRVVVFAALIMFAMMLIVAAAHSHPLTRDEPVVRMVLQEANNEPFDGMVAVAATVFDRVSDSRWPDTVRGVVYQRDQYTGMALRLGSFSMEQIALAREAVRLARLGFRPCGRSVFWYHTHAVNPWWNQELVLACKIGNHVFWRE